MGHYLPTAGDIISLDNTKAGALVMSTTLDRIEPSSTDPITMFARRDAFRTVAEAIATAMAAVPYNVYERDDDNGRRKLSAGDDPVARALEDPYPGTTAYRLIEGITLDWIIHDRWACFLETQDDGTVQPLRLPAKWVQFAVDGFRRVTHVVVKRGANAEEFFIPVSAALFDVGYDPNPSGDRTSGYSISKTLGPSATELDRGAAWREQLLAGGPRIPMYVKRPLNAPDWVKSGARDRFKETWAEYSGARAGSTPLLEDGMELAAVPELPIKDVDYRETRKAAQIEFAIAMHFPPELVGYREGNFSNVDAFREQLYIDVLGSKITALRQALNAGFRRAGLLRPDRYIEENLGVRLASSPEKQASVLQTQVGAPVKTVNEARRLLNLPPVPGGDELIVPLNVTKGGLASPTDTGPKTLARRPPDDLGELKAVPVPPAGKAVLDTMTDRFAADLSKALARQADRVKKALGSDSSPGSLDDAFNLELEDAELASVITPHSYAIALTAAAAVLDAYNPDRTGFSDDVLLPWIAKAATGTASAINSGTFGRLASAMFSDNWVDSVAETFSNLVDNRSGVWAQTVTTASASFGANDAAKVSGLGRKTWRHRGGKNARPAHAAMDGETVGIDEVFSNGLRWPGDPAGGGDNNADCHCRVEYTRATE